MDSGRNCQFQVEHVERPEVCRTIWRGVLAHPTGAYGEAERLPRDYRAVYVQEHRIGLPEIKSFIGDNDVEFADFDLDRSALQRFAKRFPDPMTRLNLDCWRQCEIDAPTTFLSMYQF
jgi:hypothetical protein